MAGWSRVVNPEPGKKYVGVMPREVPTYEDMGYAVVEAREGGPRFSGGRTGKPGQPQECSGHILMDIPLARWEEIQQVGWDGMSGQEAADELEEAIIRREGTDALRGLLSPRYGRVESDISALEEERLNG
jgi:hypothetical protein